MLTSQALSSQSKLSTVHKINVKLSLVSSVLDGVLSIKSAVLPEGQVSELILIHPVVGRLPPHYLHRSAHPVHQKDLLPSLSYN